MWSFRGALNEYALRFVDGPLRQPLRSRIYPTTDCVCCAAGGGAALAVPAPVEIAGTTMCTIPGWEYAPRWEYNKGVMTPGLEACAQVCEADPVCTGATFIEWVNPEGKTNCYLKSWAQPDGPAATPCYPGVRSLRAKTLVA